jgi:hypothetical protein
MGHPSSRDEEHMGYTGKSTLNDVLSGKSHEMNNHEERYLKLVEVNRENNHGVVKGSTKLLSQSVVQCVDKGGDTDSANTADLRISSHQQKSLQRQPHVGRFVKKTIKNLLCEIDNHSAWSEVSQAFREGGDDCWPPPSKGKGGDSDEFDEGVDSYDEDPLASTWQKGDGTNKGNTEFNEEAHETRDCGDLIIPQEFVNGPLVLAPQVCDRHASSEECRMYCQSQLQHQNKLQQQSGPPAVSNQVYSMPVAPFSGSGNSFLLVDEGTLTSKSETHFGQNKETATGEEFTAFDDKASMEFDEDSSDEEDFQQGSEIPQGKDSFLAPDNAPSSNEDSSDGSEFEGSSMESDEVSVYDDDDHEGFALVQDGHPGQVHDEEDLIANGDESMGLNDDAHVLHQDEIEQFFAYARKLVIFEIYREEALSGPDKNQMVLACNTPIDVVRVGLQLQAVQAAFAHEWGN